MKMRLMKLWGEGRNSCGARVYGGQGDLPKSAPEEGATGLRLLMSVGLSQWQIPPDHVSAHEFV
jgi:hypothetical protein